MSDATIARARPRSNEALVIGASGLGTLFEWYDFFLYGSLAGHIAAHFFSGVNETTGFIFALAAFAVGFLVRPFGALVFGRIGDIVGRKYTFLVTLTIMGLSTVLVGVLPDYAAIGIAAPIMLIGLRILQGLAIGGEFCGAVIYVAEHAPDEHRGLHTQFMPATAIGGLLLSLIIIMIARASMAPEAFADWGWRIPFVISIVLLGISLWIRLKLRESPVFEKMKAEAATSRAPLAESFLRWENLKIVLIALAAVAGQAVVFYTATFYALYFLERAARVDGLTVTFLVGSALLIGAPLVVFCGWLADKVGRRPLLLSGLALGALLFIPLFNALLAAANPDLAAARAASPVVVHANPAECSLQFDPIGRNKFRSTSCDIAKSTLARAGVSYRSLNADGAARVEIGATSIPSPDPANLAEAERPGAIAAFQADIQAALADAGYPAKADPAKINRPLVVLILAVLLGIAALATTVTVILVELFPARIRYSAMAFPQNFGNGWFGGFLPATAFAIVAATGDIFAGLWYPAIVAAVSCVICLLVLPETRGRPIR